MKLALPLLLVTLALCCPDANGDTMCPALYSKLHSFLVGSKEDYQEKISKFDPPAESIQASMKVKTCIDSLSRLERLVLVFVLRTADFMCSRNSA